MEAITEKVAFVCTIIVFSKFFRFLFNTLYGYVIGPALNLNADLKKMGQWAVVTGSTDGVGKAYAEQLAKQGIDVVLISRSKDKLDTVAKEISSTYKVNTKTIEIDFSEGNEIYSKIEKELYGMNIGILVNNVGVGYPHPDYFLETSGKEKLFHDMVQCNVVSVLAMCQIVMPGMVDRKKGVVINISSATAEIPSPLLSVYGATKMFVSKLSEDLATEYRNHGILVQCILPGYVATKMSKISRTSIWVPSPTTYVSSALKTVGILEHSYGYLYHIFMVAGVNFIRDYISESLAAKLIFMQLKNIRTMALKKAHKAANK